LVTGAEGCFLVLFGLFFIQIFDDFLTKKNWVFLEKKFLGFPKKFETKILDLEIILILSKFIIFEF